MLSLTLQLDVVAPEQVQDFAQGHLSSGALSVQSEGKIINV